MSMSSNHYHTIEKPSSESYQLERARDKTKVIRNKIISEGLKGLSECTRPQDFNKLSLCSFKSSSKALKEAKHLSVLEQDFHARIAPYGSGLQQRQEAIDQRLLSAKLKGLLPVWQKCGCKPNSDKSHQSRIKATDVDSNRPFSLPSLSTISDCKYAAASARHSQKCNYKHRKVFSTLLSLSYRPRFTLDNDIRWDCPYRHLTKLQKALNTAHEVNERRNIKEASQPPVSCYKSFRVGDSPCCREIREIKSDKTELKKTSWTSRKLSLYKELPPLFSYKPAISLIAPSANTTPAVVNLGVPSKGSHLRPALSRHLVWRFGKARSASQTEAKLLRNPPHSGVFPEKYTDLFPKLNSNQELVTDTTKTSSEEILLPFPGTMGSTRYQAKNNRFSVIQNFERSFGIPQHQSVVDFSNSCSVPVADVGHMSIPGKNGSYTRSSKSFHGDVRNGLSDTNLRSSNGVPKRQSIVFQPRINTNASAVVLRPQQTGKMLDRQKIKNLKSLNSCRNPANVSKVCELGQEYSSPVLPDASTAAYRLTHDVSFDEGSRYRGGGGTNLNGYTTHVDDSKNGSNGRRMVFANQDEQSRLNKSVEASGSDRHGPTLSFVRMDERQNPYGFTNPPSSRGQPSQVTNNTTVPMQPAVASRTTFRSSKEPRQGWNHRMGDLSISGGGYYGSNPIQPGGRVDMPSLVSLSLNPASILPQKAALTRDKNGTAIMKSRLSSKYGNRFEASYNSTSAKECSFSDPCVGAPPSFQQRLIEMSLLESDTIKHEKSRKVKRKNKQDKDS